MIEGIVTATVVTFVWRTRPEILEKVANGESIGKLSIRSVIAKLAITGVLIGTVLSWFASAHPDGLEWSIFKTTGTTELEASEEIHTALEKLQMKIAFLPDYSFKEGESTQEMVEANEVNVATSNVIEEDWPIVDVGTSVSGLVGGFLTLALAVCTGIAIYALKKRKKEIVKSSFIGR